MDGHQLIMLGHGRRIVVSGRLKVLDLFCCEGGASEGYQQGGLEILAGIDTNIKHLQIYNGHFGENHGHHMPWEEGLNQFGADADLIHASPPCQRFSSQSRDRVKAQERWEDLIPSVQNALRSLGKPYVIENVSGAKNILKNPVKLNGFMFPDDLRSDWVPPSQSKRIADEASNGVHWRKCPCTGYPAYTCHPATTMPEHWTIKRDRYFEINGFHLTPPEENRSDREVMSVTVSPNPTMVWNKVNRQSVPLKVRREVMGNLDWMSARGVGEAIPPAYTKYIGEQFRRQVKAGHRAAERSFSLGDCDLGRLF
jgi:hypothetical protein